MPTIIIINYKFYATDNNNNNTTIDSNPNSMIFGCVISHLHFAVICIARK